MSTVFSYLVERKCRQLVRMVFIISNKHTSHLIEFGLFNITQILCIEYLLTEVFIIIIITMIIVIYLGRLENVVRGEMSGCTSLRWPITNRALRRSFFFPPHFVTSLFRVAHKYSSRAAPYSCLLFRRNKVSFYLFFLLVLLQANQAAFSSSSSRYSLGRPFVGFVVFFFNIKTLYF